MACATNKFEVAVELLAAVHAKDAEKRFEEKVLPGMLVHMHSRDQDEQATMLHWAAYHGSEYGVQELLKLGASPELKNALGQSAIDVARSREQADVSHACCRCLALRLSISLPLACSAQMRPLVLELTMCVLRRVCRSQRGWWCTR